MRERRAGNEPTAIVFASAEPFPTAGPDPGGAGLDALERALSTRLPPADAVDAVVAADSGLAVARRVGVHVDLLIGDLDSADPGDVEAARAEGTRVVVHPAEKDQIDLELALDAVCDLGTRRVVVVAGAGGRLDMVLANVALLTRRRYAGLRMEAWIGQGWLAVVRAGQQLELDGRVGEVVSLLPAGGPVTGIRTDGLRYPLHDETLDSGTSRGVSNELLRPHATVRVGTGALLVVRPDALEEGP